MLNPMFNKFFGKFNKGVGVDMGSCNTLFFQQDRGIVINESSVVAINNKTDQILAIGEEARRMLGKTPGHITATKPLENGIISDFEVTEKMLKYFINKIRTSRFAFSSMPRIIVGVPLEVTAVEKKAVEDVLIAAGASQVSMVDNVMATAIGARIPIQDPTGNMIVSIGGGLTEAAVISLDGIVNWKSSRIAGLSLDKDIINYSRDEFSLMLGEMVAEDIKKKIGSAVSLNEMLEMPMRGRDILTGLPKEIRVSDGQIREALSKSVNRILDTIKATLETTPPELVADIYQKGIYLSGGGAQLKGLDVLIARSIEIPVHIADDPQTCAVRGMGFLLDDPAFLADIILPSSQ